MITEQGSWYSILCGDTNTDYLVHITVSSLHFLPTSFNLMSIINFPTRIQNYSNYVSFTDITGKHYFSVKSVINKVVDQDSYCYYKPLNQFQVIMNQKTIYSDNTLSIKSH